MISMSCSEHGVIDLRISGDTLWDFANAAGISYPEHALYPIKQTLKRDFYKGKRAPHMGDALIFLADEYCDYPGLEPQALPTDPSRWIIDPFDLFPRFSVPEFDVIQYKLLIPWRPSPAMPVMGFALELPLTPEQKREAKKSAKRDNTPRSVRLSDIHEDGRYIQSTVREGNIARILECMICGKSHTHGWTRGVSHRVGHCNSKLYPNANYYIRCEES